MVPDNNEINLHGSLIYQFTYPAPLDICKMFRVRTSIASSEFNQRPLWILHALTIEKRRGRTSIPQMLVHKDTSTDTVDT